jgi:hypothetical protein
MTGAASRRRGANEKDPDKVAQGKRNRRHGHETELMAVRYLKKWWPDAETSRRRLGADGSKQPGDVVFHPRVSLEVKSVSGSSWPAWCRQAVAQSKPGTIPMVVRRTRGVTDPGRWVVRLPFAGHDAIAVTGTACRMPGVDGVWVETSLAAVVVALLDDDGRLSEWEA